MAYANGKKALQLRAAKEFTLRSIAKKAQLDKDVRGFEKSATISVLVASVAFALLVAYPWLPRNQRSNVILDAVIEEQGHLNVQGRHDTDGVSDTTTAPMPSVLLAESALPKELSSPALSTPSVAESSEIVHVISQGRCGSKMMMHTLNVAGIRKQPFLNHLYPSQFRSLVESRKELHGAHHKIIFLFGDPIRIVQSVESQGEKYGQGWVAKHIRNLRGEKNASVADIHNRDILGLERLFDMWMSLREPTGRTAFTIHGEDGQPRVLNTTILALKYESMWDLACQTILNDHVGATIKLPEYKPPTDRFSRLPQDEKDALLATYGPLRQKVNDAQACQVII